MQTLTDRDLLNYSICPMLLDAKKDLTVLEGDTKILADALLYLHRWELSRGSTLSLTRADLNLKAAFYDSPTHAMGTAQDQQEARRLAKILSSYYHRVYGAPTSLKTLDINFEYVADIYEQSIRGMVPVILDGQTSITLVFHSSLVDGDLDLLRFIPARLAHLAMLQAGVRVKEVINFNPTNSNLAKIEPTKEFASYSQAILESLVRAINLGIKYHGCPPNKCITGRCS